MYISVTNHVCWSQSYPISKVVLLNTAQAMNMIHLGFCFIFASRGDDNAELVPSKVPLIHLKSPIASYAAALSARLLHPSGPSRNLHTNRQSAVLPKRPRTQEPSRSDSSTKRTRGTKAVGSNKHPRAIPIVGIGAQARGVEAQGSFFDTMAVDSG